MVGLSYLNNDMHGILIACPSITLDVRFWCLYKSFYAKVRSSVLWVNGGILSDEKYESNFLFSVYNINGYHVNLTPLLQ